MTARNNNGKGQGSAADARLAEVLAAYGRNPLRWPEADRVRFANLLREPELLPRDLSADADQLDKLLDTATAAAIAEPEGARESPAFSHSGRTRHSRTGREAPPQVPMAVRFPAPATPGGRYPGGKRHAGRICGGQYGCRHAAGR